MRIIDHVHVFYPCPPERPQRACPVKSSSELPPTETATSALRVPRAPLRRHVSEILNFSFRGQLCHVCVNQSNERKCECTPLRNCEHRAVREHRECRESVPIPRGEGTHSSSAYSVRDMRGEVWQKSVSHGPSALLTHADSSR